MIIKTGVVCLGMGERLGIINVVIDNVVSISKSSLCECFFSKNIRLDLRPFSYPRLVFFMEQACTGVTLLSPQLKKGSQLKAENPWY